MMYITFCAQGPFAFRGVFRPRPLTGRLPAWRWHRRFFEDLTVMVGIVTQFWFRRSMVAQSACALLAGSFVVLGSVSPAHATRGSWLGLLRAHRLHRVSIFLVVLATPFGRHCGAWSSC